MYAFTDKNVAKPAAAQSKAWVCGRSLAGIVGLNPSGGKDVSVLMKAVCSVGRRIWDWSIPRPEKRYHLCICR